MIEPKLRFKADDGSQFPDWEEKKVGSLGNIVGGGTPSTKKKEYWCGKMAWVSSADICDNDIYNINMTRFITQDAIDDSATKIVPKDSILIVSRVGVGKVAKASCDLCTSQDFTNIVNSDGDATFLSYAILRLMQSKLQCVQGTSIKGIPSDEIKNYMLRIPCLAEQQKNAEFLSTIDTVIEKQKETVSAWEERKKGVMQKLFSQEVRFKADDGIEFPEWEEKKLKNILKEYKEHSAKDGSYEHVSLTKEGVVPKSERYERDFLVKDVDKKYRITHLGDICYNPANLKFGVICRNKYGDGIFSPIYVTFKVCKDMLPEFVEMLVTRRDFIEYALKYQQGTVYERMSVSPDDLLSIKVMVPCLEEQQKIADCLVSFDEVIEKQKATLAAWEELKKGLLQQMFV